MYWEIVLLVYIVGCFGLLFACTRPVDWAEVLIVMIWPICLVMVVVLLLLWWDLILFHKEYKELVEKPIE
jgi:hypothetical protein